MSILGRGDLAPRRRRRRADRWLSAVGILAVLAAGGYAFWRFALHHNQGAERSCVTVTVTPSPGPPVAASTKDVAVRVVNGTRRVGVAHALGAELLHRGFDVRGVATSARPVTGAPQVVYGDGGEAAARLLAEHVLGATLKHDAVLHGVVQLTITDGFTRLATPAEAAAAHTRDLAVASPTPVPSRSCPAH